MFVQLAIKSVVIILQIFNKKIIFTANDADILFNIEHQYLLGICRLHASTVQFI